MENEIEYRDFAPEVHLSGVLALCEVEGWTSHRSMSAVVALKGDRVVGLARTQSDGVLQAHLSVMVVDKGLRRKGVRKRRVSEAFERSGGERVDLHAGGEAPDFYRSFAHRAQTGFRLYPGSSTGQRKETT